MPLATGLKHLPYNIIKKVSTPKPGKVTRQILHQSIPEAKNLPDPFKTDRASVNLCSNTQLMSTCLAANDEKKQHTCKYHRRFSQGDCTGCRHLRFGEFCDSVPAQYNEGDSLKVIETLPEPKKSYSISNPYSIWDLQEGQSLEYLGFVGDIAHMKRTIDNLVQSNPNNEERYIVHPIPTEEETS